MKNTDNTCDYYEIGFDHITKETEKAICLNMMVSWNGNCHDRDLWFPKSVCTLHTFTTSDGKQVTNAHVKNWFAHKLESDNAFHGYEMHFESKLN